MKNNDAKKRQQIRKEELKRRKRVNKKVSKTIEEYRDEEEPKRITFRKLRNRAIIFLILVLFVFCIIQHCIYSKNFKYLVEGINQGQTSKVVLEDGSLIDEIGIQKIKEEPQQIPDIVKKAYIAIEDERFYEHHGIDIKRTSHAIVNYIIHFGKSSFGGSTITQQLVKNYTGADDQSVKRKISEWYRALIIESNYSKDEILDMYLNYIYQGENIYGISASSKYYFNKTLDNLELEEIAFLAALNNSPNSYNPFKENANMDRINNRTKLVLTQMEKLGYISNEQYLNSCQRVDEGLVFNKGNVTIRDKEISTYYADAVYFELIDDVSNKFNITQKFAKNYLENANLKIVACQNTSLQKQTDLEFNKQRYVRQSTLNPGTTSQAAFVLIDHKTGKVLTCNGGLGKKEEDRSYNRVTMATRQTGSCIKPLSVLVPGIEEKTITASSIYNDTPQEFENGWFVEDYAKPLGNITIRRAVESSQNVPFVLALKDVGVKTSIKYLKKMGITTLTPNDETLVLALGGLEKGISPLQMAAAYATIANDGVYIEPTFYSSVNDSNGKEIKCNKQIKRKVISEEAAYIIKEMLKDPVEGENGTFTYCKINGLDIAAKTGTTDDNYDRWLCGFSPYYTAVSWFGYDRVESINFDGKNPAGLIFANIFVRIHSGLPSKTFDRPSTITTVAICKETGQRARTNCTDKYNENYIRGTEPQYCLEHTGDEIEILTSENIYNNSSSNVQTNTNDIDEKEMQKDYEHTDNIFYRP